jgi:hypothetical protein
MLMQLGLGVAAGDFDTIGTWLRNKGWRGTEEVQPPYRTLPVTKDDLHFILVQSTANNDPTGVVIWTDEYTLMELDESGLLGALGANLDWAENLDRRGKDWLNYAAWPSEKQKSVAVITPTVPTMPAPSNAPAGGLQVPVGNNDPRPVINAELLIPIRVGNTTPAPDETSNTGD